MLSTAVQTGANVLEKSVVSIYWARNQYMRQHICGQYPSTTLHGITFHSDCNFGNYLINYMEVLSEINGKKLHLNYHKLLEQVFKSFTVIFLHNHDTLPYKKFTPFKKICMQ
jgi:hypothetical protein